MTLGNKIANYRKSRNITQEALAQQLGVTNQAVSKWESDLCCPDVMLLPKIADIFAVSIDELFDRTPKARIVGSGLPWEDDGTLRVVVYAGHTMVGDSLACEKLMFHYEGPALNIESRISVTCGDVEGDVDAGTHVSCGNVGGDADAGGNISCGNIGGDADAGTYISCGNVSGDVDAGGSVSCGNVDGDIDAGGNVKCGFVSGDVDAGGTVVIG